MENKMLSRKKEADTQDRHTEKSLLTVKLWGTRGSCAAPFPDRMVYGGNTSCVSVHWEEGIAVFDAGTGILALGQWLEAWQKQETGGSNSPLPIYLFISHLHLDHIIGLPLFPPLFNPNARFHLYGPGEKEKTFQQRLTLPLSPPYWPVSISQVPASVTWHEAADKKSWELPGHVQVSAIQSNHPDGCLIYRLERGAQSVVYGLDCEFPEPEDLEPMKGGQSIWTAYKNFARRCSLLIFDAPYTQEEYPAYRGFGHSYWEKALQMARECQAARLCICHHNWDRGDGELSEIEKNLNLYTQKTNLQAEIAKEGCTINLL